MHRKLAAAPCAAPLPLSSSPASYEAEAESKAPAKAGLLAALTGREPAHSTRRSQQAEVEHCSLSRQFVQAIAHLHFASYLQA